MTNQNKTYLQILADTVGNIFGFATVGAGGAVIGATTLAASTAAGATTAVASATYNRFVKEENQADTFAKSIDAAQYVADSGYLIYEKTNPMLFSCGHFVGEKGTQVTASVLNAAYNGGKELVGFGEPNVSFEDTEDDWTLANVKSSGILAKLR